MPVRPERPLTPEEAPGIMAAMDNSIPAEGTAPPGPDPEAVAALRARLPEELAHLPVTSAAEFRQEAWEAHYTRLPISGSYIPWIGLRGFLASMTGFFALGGLWMFLTGRIVGGIALEDILLWVFLAGATVLLVWSKARSNRRATRLEDRNTVLSDISQRIDREVAAGRIPLAPPGWTGRILAPL